MKCAMRIFLIVIFSAIGAGSNPARAVTCAETLAALTGPQRYLLKDGTAVAWSPYRKRTARMDMDVEGGGRRPVEVSRVSGKETEANFTFRSRESIASISEWLFDHFQFAHLRRSKITVGSARGTEEYPARLSRHGRFRFVQITQKQELYGLRVDGRELPVTVRYEKTFGGPGFEEAARTNKYVTVKHAVSSEGPLEVRLKTQFDFRGIPNTPANRIAAVRTWLDESGLQADRIELVPRGFKFSLRQGLDLFLDGRRIGFISTDIKNPLLPIRGGASRTGQAIGLEVEVKESLNRQEMDELRLFLSELQERLVRFFP